MSDTTPAPTPASVPRRKPVSPAPDHRYRHGEIWMVVDDPDAPAVGNEIWANRPAIIVSNNVLNRRSGVAQVVYLSTATRKSSGPTHVDIDGPDGTGTTKAICEQVHSVDASRLREKIGVVSQEQMHDVSAALSLSLSIGRRPNTSGLFRKWEEHIKLTGADLATEINALAGRTSDERVEALSRALRLITIERDAFRNLFEASPARVDAVEDVARALSNHAAH